MRYNVVIETRERENDFRAEIVKGPKWLDGEAMSSATHLQAFDALRRRIRNEWPQHSFDFLHAEA